VDIGNSGRFMIEIETGNIFGIKGYGTVHRGHFYGTLETVGRILLGRLLPERLATPLPKQKYNIPRPYFRPEPAKNHRHLTNKKSLV